MSQPARDTRVVLVKPGDLLVIGNVGPLPEEASAALSAFLDTAGIKAVAFEGDVDIDVIPAAELARVMHGA